LEKPVVLWSQQDPRFTFGLPEGWNLRDLGDLRAGIPPGTAGAYARRGDYSDIFKVADIDHPDFTPDWIADAGDLAAHLAWALSGTVAGKPMLVEVGGGVGSVIQVQTNLSRQSQGFPGTGLCPWRTLVFMFYKGWGFVIDYDKVPVTPRPVSLECDLSDLNTILASWRWNF
jgi:hypothetical protein